MSFTSSQPLRGLTSSDFDSVVQDAFQYAVVSILLEGGYVSSLIFLSITAVMSPSSLSIPLRDRNMEEQWSLADSSILILFEIVTVLEKTQFNDPPSLVSSIQQYLSASLVTTGFASRFINKCVELGAQSINMDTDLVFGNVTSSPNFTVVVVEISSPTAVPATSIARENGSGTSDLPLPVWGFVLLGVAALVIGMLACRKKRSSVSALPLSRFNEISRFSRNYEVVPTHSMIYLEDIHLNTSGHPEIGDVMIFPNSQPL